MARLGVANALLLLLLFVVEEEEEVDEVEPPAKAWDCWVAEAVLWLFV